MQLIERGVRRTAKPNVFISHSSKDKSAAAHLALTLNFCAVDVWLDDWELEIGQSLTDEIARAMEDSRYIAILITEHYNSTVWTKTEYKKALAREQKEARTVMLPLIIGSANIPDFLEDKIYIDLRTDFFVGVIKLVAMVHGISQFRISRAVEVYKPNRVADVWRVLYSIGFDPYVVLGGDDFSEMLKYGGQLVRENYATFDPQALLRSPAVSDHVKTLLRDLESLPTRDPKRYKRPFT
jgi:hypothetical protein